MIIYKFLGAVLIAITIFGCTNSASNNAPTANVASPISTLKAFIEASKKKDIDTVKKSLSKGTLELADKTAQEQKTTVDELLKRSNPDMLDGSLEMRNEKIENDTATVEVKNFTNGYDTIPFVKEDGMWKIAFDKYQKDLMEKMRQEMKMPAANQTTPEANQKPAAPANKPAANK